MKHYLLVFCLLLVTSSLALGARTTPTPVNPIEGFTGCGDYMLVARIGTRKGKLGAWYLEGSSRLTFIEIVGPAAKQAKKFLGVNCELHGFIGSIPKPGKVFISLNSLKPTRVNAADRVLAHHIARQATATCR